MLHWSGGTQFGGGSVRYAVALAPGLRLYAVTREELLYDSRFVPAERGRWEGTVAIYALLTGSMHFRDPAQRFDGPVLLAVPQVFIDGAHGRRERTFWNFGEPLRICQLSVARHHWRGPQIDNDVATILSGDAEPAFFDRLSESVRTFQTAPRTDAVVAAAQIIDAFIGCGLIAEGARPEAPVGAGNRVWDALVGAWSRGALPSLIELGMASRLSIRQVQRDLRDLVEAMFLPALGWRTGLLEYRLKLAVTLLSAPEATAVGVARAVGYRGHDELTRAFKNAGIGTPREIREALVALRR